MSYENRATGDPFFPSLGHGYLSFPIFCLSYTVGSPLVMQKKLIKMH